MTAVWHSDGSAWKLIASTGFPNEQTLHDLIEQTPNMLPLSGQPQLTIIGKEVTLAGNFADLLAIDETGQVAIIEVKLKNNPESRRAVIAQILTYAAVLDGMPLAELQSLTAKYLAGNDHTDIAKAVEETIQSGQFDQISFSQSIELSLREGRFRLVLVLDQAPEELVRLVGYLDKVAPKLTLDLIIVNSFEIGGEKVIIPQRIEPEKTKSESSIKSNVQVTTHPTSTTTYIQGHEVFMTSIESAEPQYQATLRTMVDWAKHLETRELATLRTAIGSNRWILTPLRKATQPGIVSIYNDTKGVAIDIFKTVLRKHAPRSQQIIEQMISVNGSIPTWFIRNDRITQELLDELLRAYEEADKSQ